MTWKPDRTRLNFVVDAAGLVLMLSIVSTGVLIRHVLPPGSTGRHGGRALTVPVEHLRISLGLPLGVSEGERLGRLRRRFGFQLEDVRRAIMDHRRLRAGE
jgi:hypothetical protein